MSRISGSEDEEEAVAVLTEARHLENITAPNTAAHSWRLKERVSIYLTIVVYVFMLVHYLVRLWYQLSWFLIFEMVYCTDCSNVGVELHL